MSPRSLPSNLLVRIYVTLVVLLGITALLAAFSMRSPFADSVSLPGVLVFAIVGSGLEFAEHRLATGSGTGSIAFIVYLAAAIIFGPVWCASIAACSVLTAHTLTHKHPVKTAFNVSQTVLALLAGSAVYLLIGGTVSPVSASGGISMDHTILPFVGLVLTFFLVNSSAVSGAISLSERRAFVDVWFRNTWSLAGYDMVASALALGIAWLFFQFGVVGLAAVVVPILFLRHTYMVNVQLQATNRELLDLMVKAIEARDPYTSGHSQRVSQLAGRIAREMGLPFREVRNIETAALLHDVGKIYEEFAPLLRKEGRLTSDERQVMQSHAVRSAELVGTISNLRGYVERCVRHHHENFDGTGYPDKLAGKAIPVGARIILVADTADAMTTDRPYRCALPQERLIQELDKHAGRQFDPQVVAVFKRSAAVRRLLSQPKPALAAPPEQSPEKVQRLAAR